MPSEETTESTRTANEAASARTDLERMNTEELFAATLEGEYDDDAPWEAVSVLRLRGGTEVFEVAKRYCASENPKARARGLSVLAQLDASKPDTERPFMTECVSIAIEHIPESPVGLNWRFRVPDGERISFNDLRMGKTEYEAGRDFGDFVVWRRDDVPAYQLAVVVDDEAMKITEVVRGEDLLRSTARQILLQRALGYRQPKYFHCALIKDDAGERLAKRHDALSLRELRAKGADAAELRP